MTAAKLGQFVYDRVDGLWHVVREWCAWDDGEFGGNKLCVRYFCHDPESWYDGAPPYHANPIAHTVTDRLPPHQDLCEGCFPPEAESKLRDAEAQLRDAEKVLAEAKTKVKAARAAMRGRP